MPAPYPQFIPEAFAALAAGPDRNVIPDAPVTAQRASWQLGYPPQTMTPVAAGGKPMLGPDMNGVLYMMSSHAVYAQTGQPYRYNADVMVAIVGYAVGTMLGSIDGTTLWFNTVAANTTDPDAGGAGWVPMFSYGIMLLPATVGGVVNLTSEQAKRSVIVISGALVGNLQVNFPTSFRRWLVINTTSGGFTTTVKTAGGAGVQVPQGGFAGPTEVYGDGTSLYPCVAPITIPTDVAPTPNTIVLRSNVGDVYARFFNSQVPLTNLAVDSLFHGFNADGFLYRISPANLAAQMPVSGFTGQVLDAQVPQTAVTQHKAAVLASAALTGVPTAPTAAPGTNTVQVATTQFVAGTVLRANPGYEIYPNGNIRQYGEHIFGDLFAGFGTNAFNVVFAIPFPNGLLSKTFGRTGQSPAAVAGGRFFTLNGFQLVMEEWTNIVQGPDNTATWEVWGY